MMMAMTMMTMMTMVIMTADMITMILSPTSSLIILSAILFNISSFSDETTLAGSSSGQISFSSASFASRPKLSLLSAYKETTCLLKK